MLEQRQRNTRARFVVFSGHVHNYERHEHGGVTDSVPGDIDFVFLVLHHPPYTSSSDAKKL